VPLPTGKATCIKEREIVAMFLSCPSYQSAPLLPLLVINIDVVIKSYLVMRLGQGMEMRMQVMCAQCSIN
jgi:hypothetical protein